MNNISVRLSWSSNYGDSYYEDTIMLSTDTMDNNEILENCRQFLMANGDWGIEDLYDLEIEEITINR